MTPIKTGSRLQDQYPLHVELGLILALAVLIVAFRANISTKDSFTVQMQTQEAVEMTDIQQTQQERQPPPPPRPPVPQEVPNNEVISEESPDFDASLDMNETLDTSNPPPSPTQSDDTEEEEKKPEVFVAVEQKPDCGGVEALQGQVEYPELARKAGLEGRVIVQFIVNEQGNVTKPKVVSGVHNLLNKAALNAVRKLDCTAGRQRGRPVKVRMAMPVTFKLRD